MGILGEKCARNYYILAKKYDIQADVPDSRGLPVPGSPTSMPGMSSKQDSA